MVIKMEIYLLHFGNFCGKNKLKHIFSLRNYRRSESIFPSFSRKKPRKLFWSDYFFVEQKRMPMSFCPRKNPERKKRFPWLMLRKEFPWLMLKNVNYYPNNPEELWWPQFRRGSPLLSFPLQARLPPNCLNAHQEKQPVFRIFPLNS